jgi:hypothetical protein
MEKPAKEGRSLEAAAIQDTAFCWGLKAAGFSLSAVLVR